jgi:hypothetical protein
MLRKSLRLLSAIAVAILLSGLIGVGQATAATATKPTSDAKVSVAVIPKPAGADANMLVYELKAVNHKGTYARNLTITVPFDATALKFVDVTFSGESAWIQQQDANVLVYRINGLHKNHPHTATLRFAKLADAPADAALTERATYVWSVQGRKHTGSSNLPLTPKPYYALDVNAFSSPEGVVTQRFAGNVFVPGEPVSFWCNMPDGEVHGLMIRSEPEVVLVHHLTANQKRDHSYVEAIRADASGAMSIDFPVKELTAGDYSIVAYGQWSGLSAVGPFKMK